MPAGNWTRRFAGGEGREEVAARSAETRDNLEQAEADVVASGERTLVLAERVGQIGGILSLLLLYRFKLKVIPLILLGIGFGSIRYFLSF